jgi:hypothetical protein
MEKMKFAVYGLSPTLIYFNRSLYQWRIWGGGDGAIATPFKKNFSIFSRKA